MAESDGSAAAKTKEFPLQERQSGPSQPASPPKREAIATAVCLFFGLAAAAVSSLGDSSSRPVVIPLCLCAFIAGGIRPFVIAVRALQQRQLNVDLLMILAAIGAAAIGDWLEGVVLLFLFSLSGTLEAFAMYRTTRSIESLIQLRPRDAMLVVPGKDDCRVLVDELKVGDIVRVRPGTRYPVDGIITEGETWADEATLTGESEQIHKQVGSNVFSGTINGHGSVLVQMTRAVADTTLQRIVHMVQSAQLQKTPTQRFVESWQQPYVAGVLVASLFVFLSARFLHTGNWSDAFYHAMVLLVAASPCAVVVGAPAVLLSAIARAGRQGVLFKGGVHLETLGSTDTIAFDKTGTLTRGEPGVVEIWTPVTTDQNRLLSLAAAVEQRSEHPLATPVIEEVRRRGILISQAPLVEFHSHTGLGVHAQVEGVWVGIGREKMFESHEISLPDELIVQAQRMRELGQTALLIVTNQREFCGVIGVADQMRPEAPKVIASLRKMGVQRTVMLTGDHARVAAVMASRVGVDEVRASLMPDQKVLELGRLGSGGSTVAMVGDGVNDAPALAAASVGIAMGGGGTDVALEVADVVLMKDNLSGLPMAVWISPTAQRRVRQNMIFAFGMIGVLVISSFFNLPLWLGVLGHEGSTVLVVLNGLRILWEKPPVF
ncbi:MAG: heavy metal translocating P-type ATPase [Planctomycetota bacterium]